MRRSEIQTKTPPEKRLFMKSSSLIRFAWLLLFATAASSCFAQTYSMIDIGAPAGDTFAVPRAINASGQITGAAGPGGDSGNSGVFIYGNGKFAYLGTLGGDSGVGNAINSSAQVAGYSTDYAGTYRAFISKGKSLVDIGDLGGGSAVAYGINDAGAVVGSSVTADGSNHPFLYLNGKMIDLGTLGSPQGNDWWNSAEGINKSGVAVGYSYTSGGPFRGFAWAKGKMMELGTLGGSYSQAYAINNHNQVTGIAYLANGAAHAFIADASGKMKYLGALQEDGDSWGFAINNSAVVVGQTQLNNGAVHAFVYNGTKMLDLNTLVPPGSLTLIEADGVNDAGQIVCTGEDNQGNLHTMLLTPQ
jgi:probable HAF family extracellular repeat protein